MASDKIPGAKVVLSGREFIIPPITLGMLRGGLAEKLRAHDKMLEDGNGGLDLLFLREEIVIAALRRNYPTDELPDADLAALLDMRNTHEAWLAAVGISGFSPGEAEPAAAGASSQSTPS